MTEVLLNLLPAKDREEIRKILAIMKEKEDVQQRD